MQHIEFQYQPSVGGAGGTEWWNWVAPNILLPDGVVKI
jgi:hypothetical protein